MPNINNPNATILSLLIKDDNSPADGQTTNSVVAQVNDGDTVPLPGQVVTFDVEEGATIQGQSESDDQGVAIATLTSTTAGVYTVTASINDSQMTVGSTFVPVDDGDGNNPNAVIELLYVSRDNAVADGMATNEVTTEVTDGSVLLANQSVTFEADNGALIQSPILTDELGKARATLTATEAGVATVTASINDSQMTVGSTFVPSDGDGNNPNAVIELLYVSRDNAVADGMATNEVTTEVTDGSVLLANQSVTFEADNGALIQSPILTDERGKARATLTATEAGVATVTASINDSQMTVGSTFVPVDDGDGNNPNAVIELLYVSRDNAVADGMATNEVTTEVTDGSVLLANQSVTFEADNGALIQSPILTDELGKARATLTATEAGVATVTASINDSQMTVGSTFVPSDGDGNNPNAVIELLYVSRDNAVADGMATNEVTTEVTDGSVLLANQSVTFEADNGALIQSPILTDERGKARATLTATEAGVATVTASINDSAETVVVSFTDESATSVIDSLVSDKDSIVNDGTDIATLTATVINSDTGNVVSGAAVSWSTDIGTVTPAASVTDERGEAVTQLSDTGDTGTATVTAALDSGEEKTYSVTLQGPATLAVRGGRRRRGRGRESRSYLVSIDLETGLPLVAKWQYENEPTVVTGTHFDDMCPEKILRVTSTTGQQSIRLSPLNIAGFSQESTADGDAFAVLTIGGQVIAWGDSASGGSAPPEIITRTDMGVLDCNAHSFSVLTDAGGVVAWGGSGDGGSVSSDIANRTDLVALASTNPAYAALTESGGVVTWGNSEYGNSVPPDISNRTDLIALSATWSAFAALLVSGGVVAWGNGSHGGNVPDQIATRTDLMAIAGNGGAFAALTASGGVVAWGDSSYGGSVPTDIGMRSDVVEICSTGYAFAALTSSGSVVAWGNSNDGGNVPVSVTDRTDLIAIAGTQAAFAALTLSGGVVAWGDGSYGGSVSSDIANRTDLIALAGTRAAFAALTVSGNVVAWGSLSHGGSIPTDIQPLLTDIVAIYSCEAAFCALKSDNTVVVWGGGDAGKMANIPEALQGNVSYYQE
ncbi:Ig-like domain-containing protein [Serratia rhizosphaerae]|uniref:Big-1 domain-containing protein n=1 Tax=Serratia rhizosphaerae TaxID=2597702 RepID=A0ABX6GHH1_9GAMM|nr:Ig-like domain-containing protein [Serratia rhizosphaerae]QHA85716.1 hypothetical protein FO014_01280 [Serratia rhizosphaerae]